MQQYKEILYYLKLSRKSLLLYSYKYERKKDEFLSNLDHIKYESFQSLIRDHKINKIINEGFTEWIVVDINDFYLNLKDKSVGAKLKFMNSIYSKLENITDQKILLTSPQNTGNIEITGTNILVYHSDFIFNIDENINISKNRFGPHNLTKTLIL